eukprot:2051902-Rhodomonas_salina.1
MRVTAARGYVLRLLEWTVCAKSQGTTAWLCGVVRCKAELVSAMSGSRAGGSDDQRWKCKRIVRSESAEEGSTYYALSEFPEEDVDDGNEEEESDEEPEPLDNRHRAHRPHVRRKAHAHCKRAATQNVREKHAHEKKTRWHRRPRSAGEQEAWRANRSRPWSRVLWGSLAPPAHPG